jgi:hypothetical protein
VKNINKTKLIFIFLNIFSTSLLVVSCFLKMSSEEQEDIGSYVDDNEEITPQSVETPMEQSPVQSDDVHGIQSHYVVLSINASPTTLQRTPALCQAQLSDKIQKSFKRITAINDRQNAEEQHLEGELDRMVVTGIRCVGYINQSTQPILADISRHVPMTLLNNDRTNILLEPTNGFINCNIDVHNPSDLMSKDMLKIWESCDDTVLEKEFQWLKSDDKTTCLLHVDGVGSRILERMPREFNYRLGEPIDGTRYAVVPPEVSKKLYNMMQNTITNISKSFYKASDIKIRFRPESGDWVNVSSFVGDAATLPNDKKIQHEQRMLTQPTRIAVHLAIDTLSISKAYKK